MSRALKEQNDISPKKLGNDIDAPLDIKAFRNELLVWYNQHKRVLPWRAERFDQTNVYHVWLSEIMLQQTTVQTVIPYFQNFIATWPTVEHLANANDDDVMSAWAGLGYYARARNLLKCARIVAKEPYEGQFPNDENALLSLPGIGPYTAAAILSIGFNKPANVVDGNFERVIARIYAITIPFPKGKKDVKDAAASISLINDRKSADYAQAVMDLGSLVCKPAQPQCGICPVKTHCKGFKSQIQDTLPVKAEKKKIPVRKGRAYFIRNEEGYFLIEKRDSDIMLGDMYGLPSSRWHDKNAPEELPTELKTLLEKFTFKENAHDYVTHTFSHFHLKIYPQVIEIKSIINIADYKWLHPEDMSDIGIPTLYMKVINYLKKEQVIEK